jgi:hypothetical protein
MKAPSKKKYRSKFFFSIMINLSGLMEKQFWATLVGKSHSVGQEISESSSAQSDR